MSTPVTPPFFSPKTKTFHSQRPPLPLPHNTTPPTPSLTQQILSSSSNDTALVSSTTHTRISYTTLKTLADNLAFSLKTKFNLSKNDVAFILAPNSIHIPVLFLSLFSLGVVVSPSNPTNTPQELAHQLKLTSPRVVFTVSGLSRKVHESGFSGMVYDKLENGGVRVILLDSTEFESMLMGSQEREFGEFGEVFLSDTAAYLFSSGTTGRVKVVELTHGNLMYCVLAGRWLSLLSSGTGVGMAPSYCGVPLFHVYGLGYMLRVLGMGGCLVVMDSGGRFSLREMVRVVGRFGVRHLAVAPPVVVGLVEGECVEEDLRGVDVVGCGGGPLSKDVVLKFKERYPNVQLAQAYGLTETTGRIFATVGLEESRVVGATGRLMPNCQAKIVDPHTGIGLPPCTTGELWLKGPIIMKGYLGDIEATRAVLDAEGWLRTGDLCYINNEGFLFYVDRIKDLIKYKGYQIAPAELEELLQSHPDVIEAAVVPCPDEVAGQLPVAFVVKQSCSVIKESQIMDFVAQKVAPYKKVRIVHFVDTLPKNSTGKVLRKVLVAKLSPSTIISKL